MKNPFSHPIPTLRGRLVLCDVTRIDDLPLLQAAAAYPEIWPHMLYNGADPKQFSVYFDDLLKRYIRKEHIPFTVRLYSGEVVGAFKFMNVDVRNDSVTMGGTWLTPSVWGSGANTDLRFLAFQFVFDLLAVNRLEIRVHTVNQRNFVALQKLGATHEGTLRAHFTQRDGSRRDVAVFSILRNEWPAVKAGMTERMALQLDKRPASSGAPGVHYGVRLH